MIIWTNFELKQKSQNGDDIYQIYSTWYKLQGLVAQFINNDTPGIPYDLKKDGGISGLVQRLKGKQGRFRSNLSGKWVNYTGRTVISPDPNVGIHEVVIPWLMA